MFYLIGLGHLGLLELLGRVLVRVVQVPQRRRHHRPARLLRRPAAHMRSSPDAPPWLPRLARAAQCTPICGSARVGMLALEIAVRGCGICGSLLARCSHCRSRHPCWLALSEALTGLRMVILLSSGILLRSDDRRRSSLSVDHTLSGLSVRL